MTIGGTVGKNNYDFYVELNETLSSDYISTNKSTVNYAVYLKNHGTRTYSGGWSFNASYDGNSVYSASNQNVITNDVSADGGYKLLFSGSFDVEHNPGGDKVITFEASISKGSYTQWDPGACSLSGPFVLTTIPRASEPTCDANCYIANNIVIYTNRKSSEFLHTISYNFNGATGIIAQNIGDYVVWQVPTSFYQAIPNATSGTCTIYCTTYRNGLQVGDTKTCSFTALANENNVKPTTSISVVDTNKALDSGLRIRALTGDDTGKTLIRYLSDAQVTLTSQAYQNAKITSSNIAYSGGVVSVNPNATSYTHTQTFTNIENLNFSGFVNDSRGYPSVREVKTPTGLTLIPYVKLTLNKPEFYRTSQTSNTLRVRGSGNYYDDAFGAWPNSLLFEIRWYDPDTSSWTDWQTKQMTINDNNTYSFDFQLGTNFNYQKSYKFQIQVQDEAMVLPVYEESSKPGIPIVGLGEEIIEAFGDVIFYKD